MNHASKIKKILPKIFPTLIILGVFAGVLVITTSFRNPSTTISKPKVTAAAAAAAAPDMEALLNEGRSVTASGYFKATSSTLTAAAAGDYNSKFYDLGTLLVRDGLS